MNRSVRAATALMWSILPFGAVVTALNIAACADVEAAARKALSQSRDYLEYGMGHFDTVAWGRTQGVAAFFVLAAVLIGALARLIRRRERYNLVALLMGPLSLAYVFWLWHVHASNPVADDVLWQIQELDSALSLTSHTLLPHWYQPALTVTLLAAAAAQLSALALLIYSKALRRVQADDGLWRGKVLALTGPACAAAYAVVNFAGIWVADLEVGPGDVDWMIVNTWTWISRIALTLGVLGTLLAAVDISLLLGRIRAYKMMLFLSGALTLLYWLILLLAWRYDLAEPRDDTTGFTDYRPWWRTPGVITIVAVAATARLGVLFLMIRSSIAGKSLRRRSVSMA
ncbi:hypothetical protein [Streptosporangium sp. NPDC000396]|uniref:hypothetical protein n=1 Tax=Streptosporangium sp. NPDC000396 TaxID=3366185 RepID=UPI00368E9FD6